MRKELEKYKNSNLNSKFVELFQGYLEKSHDSQINENNEYDESGEPNSVDLSEEINQGSSLLLYAGHANEIQLTTTAFDTDNVSSLTNKGQYFLGCIVGCSVGSHDEKYMGLSEYLQVSKEKGSIAMFVSSILQSWTPPMYMQRELNNVIINSTKIQTIGELFKKAVSVEEFSSQNDFWYYHILGDPCTRYILTLQQIRNI